MKKTKITYSINYMRSNLPFVQLFIRVAVGSGFLSAVADRLGLWGKSGDMYVAWGNWENFVAYTKQLNPLIPAGLIEPLAIIATLLEILFAVALLAGWHIRKAAIGSGVLLVIFGMAIWLTGSIKYSFDYSVFSAAAAAFSLLAFSTYNWSIDAIKERK